MADTAELLLDQILQERGGASRFTVVEAAAARALAAALSVPESDPAQLARTVDSLAQLLPPKTDEPETADMSRLSDDEFHQLEVLLAKCRGEEAGPAIITPTPPPPTVRAELAKQLADRLDAVDGEGRYSLTEAEVAAVRNDIAAILSNLLPLTRLLPPEVFGIPAHAPRAEPTPAESEPETAPEPSPTPAPLADNIVPFSEAERGALKYGATFVSNDNPGHFGDFPRTRT